MHNPPRKHADETRAGSSTQSAVVSQEESYYWYQVWNWNQSSAGKFITSRFLNIEPRILDRLPHGCAFFKLQMSLQDQIPRSRSAQGSDELYVRPAVLNSNIGQSPLFEIYSLSRFSPVHVYWLRVYL